MNPNRRIANVDLEKESKSSNQTQYNPPPSYGNSPNLKHNAPDPLYKAPKPKYNAPKPQYKASKPSYNPIKPQYKPSINQNKPQKTQSNVPKIFSPLITPWRVPKYTASKPSYRGPRKSPISKGSIWSSIRNIAGKVKNPFDMLGNILFYL